MEVKGSPLPRTWRTSMEQLVVENRKSPKVEDLPFLLPSLLEKERGVMLAKGETRKDKIS